MIEYEYYLPLGYMDPLHGKPCVFLPMYKRDQDFVPNYFEYDFHAVIIYEYIYIDTYSPDIHLMIPY